MNKKKNRIIALLAVLLFANNLQAENNGNSEVFTFVEQMPQFPDGERELFRFLSENIQIPTSPRLGGIQGRVISQFVVNSDGRISDIKIIRSLDPFLDAEVVRVIETMPKWIPGKKNGEAVNAQFTLPVRFQIEAQEKREDVFEEVEQMPEFPGGNQALMQFLNDSIRYPEEAQRNGIEGKVVCRFVVNSDGSISDIEIVQSVHPLFNAEVVRVIESMPKWIPGKQDGRAVNVQHMIFLDFQTQRRVQETVQNNGTVFTIVEQKPKFPGGNQALMRFLSNNLRYPMIAAEKEIQGRVVVQFVVNNDGSIVDVQVLRSVHPSLDAEAVRLIQSMPKWTPAEQRGKKVRVLFTMPINFRLQ